MKQTNKNRKSKFLALCLSVMMLSSAGALFASCKDGGDSSSMGDSSSSSSSEVKDTGLIKNSGFETYDNKKGLNPIGTSVTGWSRSTNSASSGSALSSKSASGILDVSADAWDNLTGSYYESKEARETAFKTITEEDAIAKWDEFSVGDKLAYYDVWKAANKDAKIAEKFEKYESFNIDSEDIPEIANPGTRTGAKEEDTNILMIHNNYYTSSKKTQGTAQKFTSSSTVTVPAGSSAQFSVWVKTADLKTTSSSGESQDAVNKGAYISVTHSIGGKSLQALEIKNINTDEWTQYTFYLKGSSYTKTTFSLVFGLGKGGGTDVYEYVNGYAFFDDVECELITNDEYTAAVDGKVNNEITDINADAVDKTFNAYEMEDKAFAMDYYNEWNEDGILNETFNVEETTDDNGYTTNAANNPAPWLGGGFSTEIKKDNAVEASDVTGVFTKAELAAKTENKYLSTVCTKFLGDDNGDGTAFVGDNDKMLMLFSTNGVAYTAESTKTFTLSKDYMGISFYVKTSDLGGATGAGITLVDGLAETSFSAIDTSSMDGVTVGETENVYDGWQQYFFFVEKDEDISSVDFTLKFTYGPTDISSATAKTSYAEGFAAFAKFEVSELDQAQFDAVTTGNTVKTVIVAGLVEDEATGDSGFDSAAGVPTDALEKGLANLQNYKGVYSDSYRVGTNYNANDSEATQIAKRQINQYANAGLLNKDEFVNYYNSTSTAAWMAGITANANGKTNAAEVWNEVFGDATQPLFIWNDGSVTDKSYGFIGASKALSEEYTAVSVRVKTSANAVASVYLVDMDDETRQSVLSIDRKLTYWYDDNGNVCSGDPAKKSTQVVLKLNKNGLYEVNKNWSEYDAAKHSGKVYANLQAYEKVGDNLVSAEGGATHDYYDYTWNREVFYGKDGKYFADAAKTVEVNDFATLNITPRCKAEASKQMMIENITTNGEWATVTFYLRKGDDAKNYRLEVWNGTRVVLDANGNKTTPVVNPANSYVIFDTNNPGAASSNYSTLLEQYEEKATDKFEGVFSYYDTDKFVRYDADMDEDKSGNAYEYTASTYEPATAYLFYNDTAANTYTVFADYTLSEKTIVATEKPDNDNSSSSSEEDEDSSANVWLLASSIAVAAVLVLAVASIGVRKVIENANKKKGARARVAATKKPTQKKDNK